MKRITYISRAATPLGSDHLAALEQQAASFNNRSQISGVLICAGDLFFQIIEGPEQAIDDLFKRIREDHRHTDVLCLKTETGLETRNFPEWSMQLIQLDQSSDVLSRVLRYLFQVLEEARGILGEYTQPGLHQLVAEGLDPRMVPARKREKVVLFCDMVAFSRFSECLSAEDLLALVNCYLGICSRTIQRHGGENHKFIGDCVMACFEASELDSAIQASVEILGELAVNRAAASPSQPAHYLYGGIGVAVGEVLEGNIGEGRNLDYTLLGDAVNRAASLENLTRQIPYALLLSESIRRRSRQSWPFVDLGVYPWKQGHQPAPIFSLDLEVVRRTWQPESLKLEIDRAFNL